MKSLKWLSHLRFLFLLALLGVVFGASQPALGQEKCPYKKLQVLLPGEEPAPETTTGKTGTPDRQRVGVPFTVLVRACNEDWSLHSGINHVMRLTATDDTADLPSSEPMTGGEWYAEVTMNTEGCFTITAKDLTDREHYQATSASFYVDDVIGTPVALRISSMAADQIAGTPVRITVESVDEQGNPIDETNGTLTFSPWNSDGPGQMSPQTVEMTDGIWTGDVTFYLADAAPLSEDPAGFLHAVLDAADEIEGDSNPFRVRAGPYAKLLILLPGQEAARDESTGLTGTPASQIAGFAFPAQVQATDAYWNPVICAAGVRLESDDDTASAPIERSLHDGTATIEMAFGTPGTWTVTVNDPANASILSMTSLPVPVIANSPTFVIDPVPEIVTAGVSFTVTIRVVNRDGSAMTDYAGPAMLACETGPGSMSPEEIEIEAGQWHGQVTLFGAAATSSFSCIDYAAPPNVGTSAQLRVVPNEFTGLQIVLPGESIQGGLDPALTGEPAEQWAGQPTTFQILAVDDWFNAVPAITGDVLLSVTDPYADLPDTVSLDDGACLVSTTMYRAGHHRFEAVDALSQQSGIRASESSEVKVHPGPYARLMLLAPGEELLPGSPEGKIGDAVDQSISYAFNLTLLATDAWWNPRDDIEDQIEWTITDPLAELASETTLDRGETITLARLSTGGHQLITARNLTHPLIPSAMTQVRAISAGFHLEAQLNPAYVIAGEPFTLSVTVTNDAGAVMQEVNSRATVHALNAVTGEPGKGKLLNSTFQLLQGRRTVSQTYTGAEPIVLVINDEMGHGQGVTNLIQVATAPPSELRFDDPPSWVGGRKTTTVTAMVTDQYGNGIDNIPVAFSLTAGSGDLNPLDPVTNLTGKAQADYTGHSEPEMSAIAAQAAGFAAEMSIETALVDPDLPAGTITNYPNPFHPDEGQTTIAYKLERDADVTLTLYTLSGSLVFEQAYPAGETGGETGNNEVLWDGRNGQGETVASGGYILQVEAERNGESIHKMRRRIGVVR